MLNVLQQQWAAQWLKWVVIVVALVGCVGSGGCRSPISPYCKGMSGPKPELGEFAGMPRVRVGCLPFPGLFTLYEAADGQNLGKHSYTGVISIGDGEVGRGIVYTCRAGFLDIAHLRNSADLTAYIHARVDYAIRNSWPCVRFRCKEPSIHTVALTYPEFWHELDIIERERLGRELAIRISQRLAFKVMTWHELVTWYGYKSTVFVPEKASSFTYEEPPSHLIGVLLAGEALREGGDYNERMTELLEERLGELGVVSKDELAQAIDAVKGDWWSLGFTRKRNVHFGLEEDEDFEFWLAPGLDFAEGAEPAQLRLPDLCDVQGYDCRDVYAMTISPRIFEAWTIRRRLPGDNSVIFPERDFPILLADIRESLGAEKVRP